MQPTSLAIPDVLLIDLVRHGDERGFFVETFRASWFRDLGIDQTFVQDNHARSGQGVLRGLHYQLQPAAQGKLVRVTQGTVFDVAADLRRGSPNFGRWVGVELCGTRPQMLWVPPGFAHGYCVLSEYADFTYKVSAEYAPDLERGVRWDDPTLAIDWPLATPILSERDRVLPSLGEAECFPDGSV